MIIFILLISQQQTVGLCVVCGFQLKIISVFNTVCWLALIRINFLFQGLVSCLFQAYCLETETTSEKSVLAQDKRGISLGRKWRKQYIDVTPS